MKGTMKGVKGQPGGKGAPKKATEGQKSSERGEEELEGATTGANGK